MIKQSEVNSNKVGSIHIDQVLDSKQLARTQITQIWDDNRQILGYDRGKFDQQINDNMTVQERGFIRFVSISDTHSRHKHLVLPKGDVLIHSGDFSKHGRYSEIKDFTNWLKKQDFQHKVVVAGNHEFTFDLEYKEKFIQRNKNKNRPPYKKTFEETKALLVNQCTYLEGESTTVLGYKVFGSPYSVVYSRSAFQRPDKEREAHWDLIPDDTELLITHGPPYGFCDLSRSNIRCGDKRLTERVINDIKPIVHQFGHIHGGYGLNVNTQGTLFMNAANCSKGYKLEHPAFVFDLPLKKGMVD